MTDGAEIRAEERRFAKPETIWVCGACGKIQPTDLYGASDGSCGWDESCMLNAVLCDANGPPWVAAEQPKHQSQPFPSPEINHET